MLRTQKTLSGNKQILWKTEGLHANVSLHHCCMMGLNMGQASEC